MEALIELFWKSSLVLAAGGAAALLARRASAATRHLIWAASLAGTLVLPLATALLPRLPVAALPAESSVATMPALPAPIAEQATRSERPARTSFEAAGPPEALDLQWPRFDWRDVARLVWASVALAFLLRIAAGDLQLRSIARRAQRAVAREWLDLLDDCAERAGVRREVALLLSGDVEVPITFGTLRPCIVVPAIASGWSAAHKRAVLLHELAHVERGDALTQLIARLACALHWVNPLAWAAAAAMRTERERACDDRVLADGARPTDYATTLLEVARNAGPGRERAALAMARRAQLEGRLLAVLAGGVDRRPAGRQARVAVGCAAAFVVVPLAAVRAERAAPRTSMSPSIASLPSLSPAPQTSLAPGRKPAKPKLAQLTPSTPPTPPTPPSPPAPPAPAADARRAGGRNNWTSSWTDGNRSSVVNVRGEIHWNEEATDIASISSGGSFDLTVHDGGHHWHVQIFPGASGLTRTLLIDGGTRPWDAQWFARALEDLDRHSGFAADVRFPKLYRQGGARAVLDYAATIDGDYAKRRYLVMLVERDPLDDRTAVAVFRAVGTMSGDYDRAEVLKAAAAKNRLDTEAKRQAFLDACSGIHGDYERGRVLRELIAQSKLSPEMARGVLGAVAKMGGDYEKAHALTGLAQRHALDALEYLETAAKVGGDYEHARVLKALIAAQKLDGPAQLEVIRQARHLGDHESAEVLVALTGSTRLTADAQREYESAAEHLGDYSRKRVLAAIKR
jgi:beta-lactamase regulating signal transducer with metallopeptidase domain